MFLLSRAELFRLLGLAGEDRFLILRSDDAFRRWIEVGIGERTKLSDQVPEGGLFDVILDFDPSAIGSEDLRDHLNPGGRIWEVRKGSSWSGEWSPLDSERVLVRVR